MNGNVSAWAIRKPIPSILLFVILMVLGIASFKQLPVTRFPNIDIPIVQVRIYQAGTAPVELEAQVTKKIEDAVASVNGLKHVTSTVTEGASLTVIEFRLETNSDRAITPAGGPGAGRLTRKGVHRVGFHPGCGPAHPGSGR